MTKKIIKIIDQISYWMKWLGQAGLIAVMVIIMIMIIMRLLRISTLGFYESIIVTAFFVYISAWAYTELEKGHISVRVLLDKLPAKVRVSIESLMYVLVLCICVVMIWASILYGIRLQNSGSIVSQFLKVPSYLFPYLMAVSFVLFGIMAGHNLVNLLSRFKKEK